MNVQESGSIQPIFPQSLQEEKVLHSLSKGQLEVLARLASRISDTYHSKLNTLEFQKNPSILEASMKNLMQIEKLRSRILQAVDSQRESGSGNVDWGLSAEDVLSLQKEFHALLSEAENLDPKVLQKIEQSFFALNEGIDASEELDEALQDLAKWAIEQEEAKTAAGPKLLAQMLQGFKLESLFSSAAKTHLFLDDLQKWVEQEIAAKEDFKNLSPEKRREVYGNIKYLQETAKDLLAFEKVRKGSFFKRIFQRSEIKQLERKYSELQKLIDNYEKTFDFSPEEEQAFQALSIEAHRPKRLHLMQFGLDYTQGARNLIKEMPDSYEKSRFLRALDRWEKRIETDSRMGGGKPTEPLAENVKEWKKQQTSSKKFIKEMFADLKKEYSAFAKVDEKQAAKTLTSARDDVLKDHTRWGKPIARTMQLPRGDLKTHMGKDSLAFKHTMETTNSGYPSSAPRARKVGVDCIQANSYKVSIQDEEKELDIAYFSSATPVEFDEKDSAARMRATKQQSLEVLLNGAFMQLEEKGIDRPLGSGGESDPYQIDFTTVALLSPDLIRNFIHEHPGLNKILGKVSHALKMEPGNVERKMLQESVQAMRELEAVELGEKVTIRDKQGRLIEIEPFENDQGRSYQVTVETIEGQPTTFYLKFDIAYFNFGVNKVKKLMLGFLGGNQLEDDLNDKAWDKMHKRTDLKLKRILEQRIKLEGQWQHLAPQEQTAMLAIQKLENEIQIHRDLYLAAERAYRQDPKDEKLEKARTLALQRWLITQDSFAKELNIAKSLPESSERFSTYVGLAQREFDIKSLAQEIEDQMEFKDYLQPSFMKRNAYSIPSAIVSLGALLKQPVWTGCRSGKDRTSLQRMEIGVRMGMRKIRGRFLHYKEMEEDSRTFKVREEMLLNSGQIDEMAARNIGARGLNLSGAYGKYLKRFFSSGKKVANAAYEDVILGGAYKVFSRTLR